MKKRLITVIFFLVAASTMTSMDKIDFFREIPTEINGWTTSGEDIHYNKNNLYDYINGGAELYLSYGFRKLWTRKYLKNDQPEIIVDIFDMGSSFNAYGVFSHSRETSSALIGQGSEYGGGLLIFWKGQYYISIMAYPENDLAKATVIEIGKKIEQLIREPGKLPDIISTLPSEGLVEESIRYFRHYIWLNSHFYISDKNILNISDKSEAVLARYKTSGQESFLLLVYYPDKNKAQTAFTKFINVYLPHARNGIGKLKDGKWAGSFLDNQKIWVVLNAGDRDVVSKMIASVKE